MDYDGLRARWAEVNAAFKNAYFYGHLQALNAWRCNQLASAKRAIDEAQPKGFVDVDEVAGPPELDIEVAAAMADSHPMTNRLLQAAGLVLERLGPGPEGDFDRLIASSQFTDSASEGHSLRLNSPMEEGSCLFVEWGKAPYHLTPVGSWLCLWGLWPEGTS